ncbi:hypothetical protein FDF74_03035 [Clostridium niameyense]|uniref:Uncharacterized protein n=1 Tax=Clostridium niameyense TaxID=1622073 RepID=A0A6M0R7N0_9CLOT|nr:hypothetical protein [Clostridium niameyense]NEZ46184.1 hypothetical protein [Clostridium niameyense]
MCNIPKFDDFINKYPKYKKYAHNKYSINVFEFLSDPVNINKMLLANSKNKPALSGCISELESKFNISPDFDFNNPTVKQAIGSMVKIILTPFGYTPKAQKKMPKGSSKYFKSSTNYRFDSEKALLKIVPTFTIKKIK